MIARSCRGKQDGPSHRQLVCARALCLFEWLLPRAVGEGSAAAKGPAYEFTIVTIILPRPARSVRSGEPARRRPEPGGHHTADRRRAGIGVGWGERRVKTGNTAIPALRSSSGSSRRRSSGALGPLDLSEPRPDRASRACLLARSRSGRRRLGQERIDEQHPFDVAAGLEVLGIDDRDLVLSRGRPDQGVPE